MWVVHCVAFLSREKMPTHNTWFTGAPVTQFLCYTVLSFSLFTGLWDKLYAALALKSAVSVLSYHAELYRLLTSSLLFCDNMIAAAFAAYLLFYLRLFERQMGSSKYAAYVTLCTLVDMGARAAFLAMPGGLGAEGVASGPFHIIFGLLPLYVRAYPAAGDCPPHPPLFAAPVAGWLSQLPPRSIFVWLFTPPANRSPPPTPHPTPPHPAGTVPVVHHDALTIVGVRLSDKAGFYVVCLILAASDGPRSAWPCLCALALGVLYALPQSPLGALRYPKAMRQCARAVFLPLLQSTPPSVTPGQAATGIGAGPGSPRAAAAAVPAPGMAIPMSSEDVNTLVSMGFSRDEAAQALRAHRGNLNAAADDLLQR